MHVLALMFPPRLLRRSGDTWLSGVRGIPVLSAYASARTTGVFVFVFLLIVYLTQSCTSSRLRRVFDEGPH